MLANYQFAFNGFLKDRTTSEDFVVPRSTATHGVGLGWEYRRGGYSFVTNAPGTDARRGMRGAPPAP